ncbi:two component regulator with propeller domain [Pseudobacter ginsenosidimutans]|uniref:Two component regulator with propeller domain n=2 Tax=Pseudobacter ginsenosidimutans TaxID=661488 RepID=A0A4Q7N481_9BACT|nr:two component regulator with propeller domain [Pseudobacter ginsenosidimutans]
MVWAFCSRLVISTVAAQTPDIVFHHLTEKDGLSSNFINCLLKDSRGILWIGTLNGLNRYDGRHFYSYHSSEDSNSLPHNMVHALAEDKNGNIWGGTDYGVFCWNRKDNRFRKYQISDSPVVANTFSILCTEDGSVWASSLKGFYHLPTGERKFRKIQENRNNGISFSDNSIRKNGMVAGPDKKSIWLVTREGLMCYLIQEQQWLNVSNNQGYSLFNGHSAAALSATPFGHFWYYDNKDQQLVAFDPLTKKVKYTRKLKPAITGGLGATILEDKNHRLWVCNWNYEMFTLDYLGSNTITPISHSNETTKSIAGDFFWAAMQDTDGNIWLGTVGGISICNPDRSFYKVHSICSLVHGSKNISIHWIAENKMDSSWWISTDAPALIRYDPVKTGYRKYEPEKFIAARNIEKPTGIHQICFVKGKPVIATTNGVWRYDAAKDNFVPFNLPPPFHKLLFTVVHQYNDSSYYFSDRYNLVEWNCFTNKATQVKYPDGLSFDGHPPESEIMASAQGSPLWVVNGHDWVSRINRQNQPELFRISKSVKEKYAYYTALEVDVNGNLWAAKPGDGLYFYDTKTGIQRSWTHEIDRVMALKADGQNKIWCATFNQVAIFNPAFDRFYKFTLPLANNNYGYQNRMIRLNNGNIVETLSGYAVEFFPDRLSSAKVINQPNISQVEINDSLLFPEHNSALHLAPEENNLRLKFGLLTDAEAYPYDMLFRLDGAEDQWRSAGNDFEANYNQLRPGNYTFSVKAVARDGNWQSMETSLRIHIAAPFFKKWWFPWLALSLVLIIFYLVYKNRIRNTRRLGELQSKAQLLEKEKALVMYENLKQHLNPHFLFNSLTSLSSLITIDQKMAVNFLDKMSKVYRYILKNRENEVVPLNEELKFVQLYIHLLKTRFEDGIRVNIEIDEEYLHRKIAPVTLQNLVENAIKHNIADSDSPLVIDLFVKDDNLVVRNNLQKKSFVETSNKQGLASMQSLYAFLSSRPLLITEDEQYFTITVPLL